MAVAQSNPIRDISWQVWPSLITCPQPTGIHVCLAHARLVNKLIHVSLCLSYAPARTHDFNASNEYQYGTHAGYPYFPMGIC